MQRQKVWFPEADMEGVGVQRVRHREGWSPRSSAGHSFLWSPERYLPLLCYVHKDSQLGVGMVGERASASSC